MFNRLKSHIWVCINTKFHKKICLKVPIELFIVRILTHFLLIMELHKWKSSLHLTCGIHLFTDVLIFETNVTGVSTKVRRLIIINASPLITVILLGRIQPHSTVLLEIKVLVRRFVYEEEHALHGAGDVIGNCDIIYKFIPYEHRKRKIRNDFLSSAVVFG